MNIKSRDTIYKLISHSVIYLMVIFFKILFPLDEIRYWTVRSGPRPEGVENWSTRNQNKQGKFEILIFYKFIET